MLEILAVIGEFSSVLTVMSTDALEDGETSEELGVGNISVIMVGISVDSTGP